MCVLILLLLINIIIIKIISLHQIIGLAPSYLVKHEKLGDLYIDNWESNSESILSEQFFARNVTSGRVSRCAHVEFSLEIPRVSHPCVQVRDVKKGREGDY